MSSHELKIDSHIVTRSPISSTNEIANVAGVSRPIVEKIQPRRSKKSPSGLTVARVTRSRSKKKSKEPISKQIVVDLDPSEEVEETMDAQNLDKPEMQEMDTSKEEESQQDPMNTMVIVTSPDVQTTPPPKEPTKAPR